MIQKPSADVRASPDASSFELLPVANVTTFERTFVLPHWFGGVTAIRTSTTKRGVAGRDLLGMSSPFPLLIFGTLLTFVSKVSTTSSHIVSLPYKVLNPRRPPHGKKPTAEETEEGLVPYDPVLLGDGKTGGGAKRILSHVYRVNSPFQLPFPDPMTEALLLAREDQQHNNPPDSIRIYQSRFGIWRVRYIPRTG